VQATRTGIDRIVLSTDANAVAARLPDWEAVTRSQLRLRSAAETAIRNAAVDQTSRIVHNRLDSLGLGEGNIQRYGAIGDYELLAELPGVDDPDRVRSIIKATAVLEFKLVDGGPFSSPDAALQSYGGTLPGDLEVVADNASHYYAIQRTSQI